MTDKPTTKARIAKLRGKDPASKLQRAVVEYVESRGGRVIVIGGVELIQFPGDEGSFNFRIAVKCTGTAPQKNMEADADR